MVEQVSFTRPGSQARGTSEFTRQMIAQLLQSSLNPQRIDHPAQGFAQLARAALVGKLMGNEREAGDARQAALGDTFQQFATDARGTPSTPVASDLADITQGVELDPGGGFRSIDVPGDRQAALAQALQNPEFRKFAQTSGGSTLLEQIAPLPPEPKAETFGQPVAGIGEGGQPAFFRPGSQGTNQPVKGFTPAEAKRPTKVVVDRDDAGNITNVLVDALTGETIRRFGEGPSVRFQPPGLPGVTSGEAEKLRESEIATTNTLESAIDLIELIKEGGPEALSSPGMFASTVLSLRSQTTGFAKQFGVITDKFESGADTTTADSKAEGIFVKLGVSATINAQIKSVIVNLAFAAAAASGQTGRSVSDRDYERFVKELAAGAADPGIFISVIEKFSERINRNFQTRYRVISRDIKGVEKSAPDLLGTVRARRSLQTTAITLESITGMSMADLINLTDEQLADPDMQNAVDERLKVLGF